jgi:hypothetical protein
MSAATRAMTSQNCWLTPELIAGEAGNNGDGVQGLPRTRDQVSSNRNNEASSIVAAPPLNSHRSSPRWAWLWRLLRPNYESSLQMIAMGNKGLSRRANSPWWRWNTRRWRRWSEPVDWPRNPANFCEREQPNWLYYILPCKRESSQAT